MGQLDKAINNLSLWEMKSYVRKAQNAMLNLTEVEAKVREATNNEPWGASTTLMATIARATFNYRDREEICNMIFRRFTEKSVREWRQIYKSLVLMEYLVKNGSERFVDDARANVALVTMLKSFHYIDSKGVDQGINVRNRSRELSQLLNDENLIREERKKAKDNAKKFGAVSSSTGGVSSSHVGGDGYETRVFGDGGVYGQRYEEQRVGGTDAFEEYDIEPNRANPTVETTRINAHSGSSNAAANGDDFDDDFDDFQSAAPTTAKSNANNDLMDLLDFNAAPSTTQTYSMPQTTTSTVYTSQPVQQQQPIIQSKPKDDIFGDLLMSAKKPAPVSQSKSSNNTNFDSLLDL